MSKIPFPFSMIALALLLSGCVTYQHPEPVEAKDALKQAQGTTAALNVPDAVQAARLPAPSLMVSYQP